jgi:hypothetical protein
LIIGGIVYFTARSAAKPTALAGDPPSAPVPDATADVTATDEDKSVYSADFTAGRPPEFSGGSIQTTRIGSRPMLGRFGQQDVTCTLNNAPPHQFVHVIFDLAILNSWNGSNMHWGPDVWTCRADDGPELCRASFCNCGFFSNNNEQSYPDEFPIPMGAASHPGWAGAAEHEDLGERNHFSNTSPEIDEDCSGVYHMDWTFPHKGSQLIMHFQAINPQKIMRWGLLSFYAKVLDQTTPLTDAELNSAWADLSGSDFVKANNAVWRLIAVGDQAVDFLQKQPNLIPPPFKTLDESAVFQQSRVRHILRVVDTPKARALRSKIDSGQAVTPDAMPT